MKHSAPRLPKRRAVRLGLVLTPVLAVAVGTSVIWQTSYAAFTATTANGTNNWQSGGITLTDNDSDGAMFNVTNIKPGQSDTRCITVTAGGSLAAAIKLYGTGFTQSNALASSINLVITKGTSTGATFSGCGTFTADTASPTVFSGPLASFAAATAYTNGYSTWTTAGGTTENRTFKFAYTMDATAPTTTQNSSAAITFTWESQPT